MRARAISTTMLVAALLSACEEKKTAPKAATVSNAVAEANLTTVTLTEAAVKRLGIETVAVEDQAVPQTRVIAGELQSLPGQNVTMSAPSAGIIVPAGRNPIPLPGAELKRGQVVLGFVPIQSGTEASGSGDDVRVREAEYEAAKRRAERTEKLVPQRAASAEDLETARADLARAEARLKIARAQRDFTRNDAKLDSGQNAVVTIGAPTSGVLQSLLVSVGQNVAAGQALFNIQGQSPLWARVQVFSGQLADIDASAPASVSSLNGTDAARVAAPAKGPTTANPATAAADLYYQLENADGLFRPGERALVRLALKGGAGRQLSVPHSAFFRDIHGGTWVYENTAPNVFVRRRVVVAYVADARAVLSHGPAAGTKVVSVGVAELAGTEFGVGK